MKISLERIEAVQARAAARGAGSSQKALAEAAGVKPGRLYGMLERIRNGKLVNPATAGTILGGLKRMLGEDTSAEGGLQLADILEDGQTLEEVEMPEIEVNA